MRIYLIKNEKKNNNSWPCILKDILIRDYHLSDNDIVFEYNQDGKPYLLKNPLCFNISHSGNLLVIGISDTEVGVDVELIETRKYQNDIAKRVFNEIELERYNENNSIDYFYEVWTKKEAYVKLIGTGIKNLFKTLPSNYDQVIISKKIRFDNLDFYLSYATYSDIERNNVEIIYE